MIPRNHFGANFRSNRSRTRTTMGTQTLWRACALGTVCLILVACATPPHTRAPDPQPAPKPATSVTTVPIPSTPVPDSHTPVQNKTRAKPAPAKIEHDSLAPSDVGYYMDVLNGRLQQVRDRRIEVSREGDRIVLILPFLFDPESADLQIRTDMREILSPLSKVFAEYHMTSIQIRVMESGGNTNAPAADQHALALARYLGEEGVARNRIVIAASGINDSRSEKERTQSPARVMLLLGPIVRLGGDSH